MSPLTRQILEHKQERRRGLAQLPYPEKVRIVEKLRESAKKISQAARQGGLRQSHSGH
jgi:hypothetical protein